MRTKKRSGRDESRRSGQESTGGPGANGSRRRFSAEEKSRALEMVGAQVCRAEVAKAIGCSTESIRLWAKEARRNGTSPAAEPVSEDGSEGTGADTEADSGAGDAVPIYQPRDPGQGLGAHEVAAILEIKKRHPSMGPAQIRAQLKRFQGWRIAVKAIARVLTARGYVRVHRGSRPAGPEPIRFEAPRRNAIWQMDYADLRVVGDRLTLLVILDDFSRFVVGHGVGNSPTSKLATTTLAAAIARHGKPEAVRTDRGGGFLAKSDEADFGPYLEAELIDHIVGRAYHPQGGGKVESLVGTVRRELWDVEEFTDRAQAERRLAEFFSSYNESRAHMGIGGLTPADRFFGRGDRVLAAIDAVSRRRQGALALAHPGGGVFEDRLSAATGAPLEVLRLVRVEDRFELHFCGARVVLGTVQP